MSINFLISKALSTGICQACSLIVRFFWGVVATSFVVVVVVVAGGGHSGLIQSFGNAGRYHSKLFQPKRHVTDLGAFAQ
jgi:hypothetical protein